MRRMVGALSCASLATTLSACPFVMEDPFVIGEEEPSADAGVDAPVAPDTAATCGVTAPNAGGACPPGCECPDATTCILRCEGKDSCKDMALMCPPNRSCTVLCEGDKACEKASIECAPGRRCDIVCGKSSCNDLSASCSNGPCTLSCPLGCDASTTLLCGTSSCDAICGPGPGPKPSVACGASCDCSAC